MTTTPAKPEGKVWRTIPFAKPIEYDGESWKRLELGPLLGAHLFTLKMFEVTIGDLWTVGGLMAGMSARAAEAVLGDAGPRELSRLAESVTEALGPYNDARAAKLTFDTSHPHTFTAATAVEQGNKQVREFTLQPMKGSMVWNIPGGGRLTPSALVDVAVAQSGTPAVVFGRLGAADFGALLGCVEHFLGAFQPTGAAA